MTEVYSMKRHALLLFLSILVICFSFILLTSVNCLFSPMRTNLNHEDSAHFERITGFRANSILFVDALQPSMLGEGGHLTYGALVSNFAEETLREKGWEKQENLASLQFNPGTSLKTIADSNHNIYIRGEDRHQVVLICSPCGDDDYLIFVSADPYLAFN